MVKGFNDPEGKQLEKKLCTVMCHVYGQWVDIGVTDLFSGL